LKINEIIHQKVLRTEDLPILRKKSVAQKITFTNGCFDLIHPGHIHLLYRAKEFGDILIVGLNSDESVRSLKGETRPVKDEYMRMLTLASFFFVDYVILFSEQTPEKLIHKIRPNILVKGGDYNESEIVGADFVKSYGGMIKIIPFLENYSTSSLIGKV